MLLGLPGSLETKRLPGTGQEDSQRLNSPPVTVPAPAPTCATSLTASPVLSVPRDSVATAPGPQKAESPSIDYAELLRHFDRVQKQHLEVRHQRSGRGDHLDRRVIL